VPGPSARPDRVHVDRPALELELAADLEPGGRRELDAVRGRPPPVRDRDPDRAVRRADGPDGPDLPHRRLPRGPTRARLDPRHLEPLERRGEPIADGDRAGCREREASSLARRAGRDDDVDLRPGLRRGDERMRPVALAAPGDPLDGPPARAGLGPQPQDPVRGLAAARLAVEPARRDRDRGGVLGHGVPSAGRRRARSLAPGPGMGLPEFESGSRAPKARRMDQ
jgi:hypothetical protein